MLWYEKNKQLELITSKRNDVANVEMQAKLEELEEAEELEEYLNILYPIMEEITLELKEQLEISKGGELLVEYLTGKE